MFRIGCIQPNARRIAPRTEQKLGHFFRLHACMHLYFRHIRVGRPSSEGLEYSKSQDLNLYVAGWQAFPKIMKIFIHSFIRSFILDRGDVTQSFWNVTFQPAGEID